MFVPRRWAALSSWECMGAEPPAARERRPAIWPWLVMPLVVLAVFYALFRMRHPPGAPWSVFWSHAADDRDSTPAAQ